jgi:hypothetical protein
MLLNLYLGIKHSSNSFRRLSPRLLLLLMLPQILSLRLPLQMYILILFLQT